MSSPIAQVRRRASRVAREFRLHALGIVAVLAAFELVLHALNLPYLRADGWSSIRYRYDPELGWSPVANLHVMSALPRTIALSNNSLGLRDREFRRNGKPTILFLGDSLTWGYNVEASERFTDLLREQLPAHNVLNAGVSGFGTDQEYL